MGDLVFDFSPAQSQFVLSDAHIVQFRGPMGEGKTFAGVGGLIAHAARCGRDIRCALVRDTHQNIKTSTVPDIKEVLGPWVSFHDDDKKAIIATTPRVELDLFGVGDSASLSKLQGPQYAAIWLEEPAPIEDKKNAGLPKSVFDMAIARATRQRGTTLRVQITQNPADEDHWTEDLAAAPRVYEHDHDTGLSIIKETIDIPYGENKYANPLMRLGNKAAFKDDPGKYARYVLGIAATVLRGKKVTATYNPEFHYSKHELPVIDGAVGIRGWDGWHHPCCIIGQLVPPNRLIIHHVCVDELIGPQELTTQQVIPIITSPKYAGKIHEWRDIGDPTMMTPDQSSRSRSAAKVIEDLLSGIPKGFRARFEPGPVATRHRLDPLNTALGTILPDGKPQIILSKTAFKAHRALSGGWHWKTDNSGRVVGAKPEKDLMGDIGDAIAYPVAVLFPYKRTQVSAAAKKQQRHLHYNTAMSYAPPGAGSPTAQVAGSFVRG